MDGLTLNARSVPLGGVRGVTVDRTLPHRDLPTVGAWCFFDHFGPSNETMAVLPHPHIGLQTVTWPLAGDIRHRDSLGSDQVLLPGELNLMTSGDGVAHSEFSVEPGARSHGLQLWVALPDDARRGPAGFEYHPALPRHAGDGWEGSVMMGELDGVASPATIYSPLVGAQLALTSASARLPLRGDFEHAVMGVDGPIRVDGVEVARGDLRYVPVGAASTVVEGEPGRAILLIGGEPFGEDLVMWWNFVGRSHDDIAEARADWEAAAGQKSDRFGFVDGHDGAWIPAPPLPDVVLKPRRRRI